MAVYREFNSEELWREYNIEATVPSIEPFRDQNIILTEEMKRDLTCYADLAFGSGPMESLDIYPAQNVSDLAPAYIFFHGGYWRLGSKNGSGFMAKCLTEKGVAVAPIDYALAPDVSLDEIVRQARASVAWFYHHGADYGVDRERIYVSGSSAGGHLSAMIMAPGWQSEMNVPEDLVKGAMLFSGLYDLEPLRHCEPNDWLELDEASVRRNSPIYTLPNQEIPLVVAYGSEETDEFKRQSDAYAYAWREKGFNCSVFEMSDYHHFNMTSMLTESDSLLTGQVLSVMGMD